MNADSRCDAVARERHRTLDFIGLRAHATTVGLIQLCEELLNAGVLKPDGLERIKGAIRSELTVCNARISNQPSFDSTLRRRIDSIFPQAPGQPPKEQVGSLEEFEDALGGYHGA
ncbi:MAG: hypothetical protein U0S50_16485 [Sphingopyxis sp.]|uniref:hypothetical protein n=1 Tax=Sphingopyxis sp. TaxID=1908224 RepID=UPI002ABAEBEB|nr:hypothetical protein [Sphingopyxis sp.]MDZ3833391.1 hypothetical protein [Sphingopyxis sp.]